MAVAGGQRGLAGKAGGSPQIDNIQQASGVTEIYICWVSSRAKMSVTVTIKRGFYKRGSGCLETGIRGPV